jgi:hypothetical protein
LLFPFFSILATAVGAVIIFAPVAVWEGASGGNAPWLVGAVLGLWALNFIGTFFGVAFIATFFVVPVIALEGVAPVAAARRPVDVVRKRWGAGVAGSFAIGGIFTIVFFAAIVPLVAGLAYLRSAPYAAGPFAADDLDAAFRPRRQLFRGS